MTRQGFSRFTKEQYFELFAKLMLLGFRRMVIKEIFEELQQQEKIPKKLKKIPKGFTWQWQFIKEKVNEFGIKSIQINTTYREDSEGNFTDNGLGWVVLKDSRVEEKLFSFEIRKTENFLNKILDYASAYSDLLDNWPQCNQCHTDLVLQFSKSTFHAMEFVCITSNKTYMHRQRRPQIYLTNINIKVESKKFLDETFHRAYKRMEREHAKGIFRKQKRITRAEAKIPKPHQ